MKLRQSRCFGFCDIVKLYWYPSLKDWKKEDRVRTCYLATCYCYVNEIEVGNVTLRERLLIAMLGQCKIRDGAEEQLSEVLRAAGNLIKHRIVFYPYVDRIKENAKKMDDDVNEYK